MSMFGRRSPAAGMALACVVALALCVGMSSATSYADLDSDLVETETGWQFDDDTVEAFDNATAPAPAPAAAKAISGRVPLDNGDFEKANVTGNATVLATDGTMMPNWMPGQAGVQVRNSLSRSRSLSLNASIDHLSFVRMKASSSILTVAGAAAAACRSFNPRRTRCLLSRQEVCSPYTSTIRLLLLMAPKA